MHCPNCGAEINDDDAKYCPDCGANTTQNQAPQDATTQQESNTQRQATTQGTTSTSLADKLPLRQGALIGAVAFVLNYGLTYILLRAEIMAQSGSTSRLFKYAGWALYNAHTVTIESPFAQSGSFNWLEQVYATSGTTIPKPLYYLLPILVLGWGGYYVATNYTRGEKTRKNGALAGTTIAVGYALLAIIGASAIFTISGDAGQGVTLKPSLTKTIMMMGIVYPVAIGGAAGYLSTQ